jgi:hypothetical protein
MPSESCREHFLAVYANNPPAEGWRAALWANNPGAFDRAIRILCNNPPGTTRPYLRVAGRECVRDVAASVGLGEL